MQLRGFEVWLPDRSKCSTSAPKTLWEVMPVYTRCYEKRRCLVRGKKPKALADANSITARQWKMYQTHLHRKSPVLTGLRYLKLFEQESVTSYAKAAAIVGVSRIRVYQLVSLVTKLSPRIIDYLVKHNDDPKIRRHFTERRLRPLIKLSSHEDQQFRFQEMLEEAVLSGRDKRSDSD